MGFWEFCKLKMCERSCLHVWRGLLCKEVQLCLFVCLRCWCFGVRQCVHFHSFYTLHNIILGGGGWQEIYKIPNAEELKSYRGKDIQGARSLIVQF